MRDTVLIQIMSYPIYIYTVCKNNNLMEKIRVFFQFYLKENGSYWTIIVQSYFLIVFLLSLKIIVSNFNDHLTGLMS